MTIQLLNAIKRFKRTFTYKMSLVWASIDSGVNYCNCIWICTQHVLTTEARDVQTRGANGSDTDRIVVKQYPYPFLFFGYGYESDIRQIHTDRISDIRRYIHKYFHNIY